MRNIIARHSAMAVVLAIVVAMPFAAAAADLFWYGTASDGLWNNPANWSTTEASYTAGKKMLSLHVVSVVFNLQ